MSNKETSSKKDISKEEKENKIIVRAYPKTVYLWPTMVIGFIFWIISVINNIFTIFSPQSLNDIISVFASLWLIIITFNLIVISFDFSVGKLFTILTTVLCISLLYILLRDYFKLQLINIFPSIKDFLTNSGLSITPVFYLYFSFILLFLYLIIWLEGKIHYWEFQPNRITYHKGLFNDEESFPAQQSRIITETTDIFERLLFRAGTIFVVVGDNKVHKLENVYNAATKNEKIQKLVSFIQVDEEK